MRMCEDVLMYNKRFAFIIPQNQIFYNGKQYQICSFYALALIFTSGSGHSIPGSLVGSGSSAATLTVHMYILSNEGLHVNEAFASAVVLLALTFLINLVSDLIERRIAKKKG